MKLNLNEYRDKVYACWVGKNIGGTMGTPYEGGRELLDIKGFATAPNVVLPNDDLDLQIVWLHALEKEGPYGLDSKKLGEYWLSFITPYWNEYGIGKTNMRRGLMPPLSGDYQNTWQHSNGAWIRTEIWASLAPAAPAVAAKYAMEDAAVDHGAGEGTAAAAFVAAMQSAAFAETSVRRIVEVGLAAIPKESRVAKSIRLVMDMYDAKKTPVEARNAVLEQNKDIGDGWFEAPSNVAYTVLGLLYGEGDFKKSMILAINCGDDTDCTGATVGSTLGILGGMAAIPEDWRAYIGDTIVTVCIPRGFLYGLPDTCQQLTDRVIRQTPVMLVANNVDLTLTEGKTELPADVHAAFLKSVGTVREKLENLKPYSFTVTMGIADVTVQYLDTPDIRPNGESRLKLTFRNNWEKFGGALYFFNLRWILPEGFSVRCQNNVRVAHINAHYNGLTEVEAVITAGDVVLPKQKVVLEVTVDDRYDAAYLPIPFLG